MPRVAPPVGGRMREPFDPNRVFLVVRDLSVGGKKFAGNDRFNKGLVTGRRLRQMYECRMLKMAAADDVEDVKLVSVEPAAKPSPPDFKALSQGGLRRWLKEQGVNTPPRTPHEKLVEKALAAWEKSNGIAATNGDSTDSGERLPGLVDDGNVAA